MEKLVVDVVFQVVGRYAFIIQEPVDDDDVLFSRRRLDPFSHELDGRALGPADSRSAADQAPFGNIFSDHSSQGLFQVVGLSSGGEGPGLGHCRYGLVPVLANVIKDPGPQIFYLELVPAGKAEANDVFEDRIGSPAEEDMESQCSRALPLAQGDGGIRAPGEDDIEVAGQDELRLVAPEQGADFFLGVRLSIGLGFQPGRPGAVSTLSLSSFHTESLGRISSHRKRSCKVQPARTIA